MDLSRLADLERWFDGPIPAYLLGGPTPAALARADLRMLRGLFRAAADGARRARSAEGRARCLGNARQYRVMHRAALAEYLALLRAGRIERRAAA